MGWRDRDYARRGFETDGGWRPRTRIPLLGGSVVSTLLAINIAVFVICQLTVEAGGNSRFYRYEGALASPVFRFLAMTTPAVLKGQVWRLITPQYLHWNFEHILMNMLGLLFLGRALERDWGPKRFFGVYLVAGTLGTVFYLVLTVVGWLPRIGVLAGASGCVLGLLGACAVRYPHAQVYIYFLFPIKIRTAALLFTVWYALNLYQRGPNAGGDACHLAGLIFGAWWAYRGENWWDRTGSRWSQWRGRPRRVRVTPFTADFEQRVEDEETIDRILKKVYDGGLHSLSEAEKRALREATERQRAADAGRFDSL